MFKRNNSHRMASPMESFLKRKIAELRKALNRHNESYSVCRNEIFDGITSVSVRTTDGDFWGTEYRYIQGQHSYDINAVFDDLDKLNKFSVKINNGINELMSLLTSFIEGNGEKNIEKLFSDIDRITKNTTYQDVVKLGSIPVIGSLNRVQRETSEEFLKIGSEFIEEYNKTHKSITLTELNNQIEFIDLLDQANSSMKELIQNPKSETARKGLEKSLSNLYESASNISVLKAKDLSDISTLKLIVEMGRHDAFTTRVQRGRNRPKPDTLLEKYYKDINGKDSIKTMRARIQSSNQKDVAFVNTVFNFPSLAGLMSQLPQTAEIVSRNNHADVIFNKNHRILRAPYIGPVDLH